MTAKQTATAMTLTLLLVTSTAFAVPPANVCPSSSEKSAGASVVLDIEDSSVVSSIWENGTVSLAIPIDNSGNTSATNVSITSIQGPPSSSYLGPTAFPYVIGDLLPDDSHQLNAQFGMSHQQTHSKYPLIVHGSYQFGSEVCPFSIQTFVTQPSQINAGQQKLISIAPVFTVDTAFYPAAAIEHLNILPNTEKDGSLLPLGQPRNLFTAPPAVSVIDEVLGLDPNDLFPPPNAGPDALVVVRNSQAGATTALVPDPNVAGATPTGFVLTSNNSGVPGTTATTAAVSVSTDYGKTFTVVNLTKATGFKDPSRPNRTDFFPEDDGGLCCDQVVIYIPARNLVVWLLQYWSPKIVLPTFNGVIQTTGQNRLRIAYATPEAASADFLHAWRWFDLTPKQLGLTTVTDNFDFPDLSYSDNFLYISIDHGIVDSKNTQKVLDDRRIFIRASLDDMVNHKPITLQSYEAQSPGLAKAHFAQSARNTMFFAALPNTSTLGVFVDPDSSPYVPEAHNVKISSFCETISVFGVVECDYAALAPDGLDWNRAPHTVQGATYVDATLCGNQCNGPTHLLYFAFDAGRNPVAGRPFPYIRIVKLDAETLDLNQEFDIWNPDFAYGNPALVWRPGSDKDEVAVSLARGGPTRYADNAVGFLGDYMVYTTTSSNATKQSFGGGPLRYGDYFGVRNATGPVTLAGQGVGYTTLGYAVTQDTPGRPCATGGCTILLQYVLFGRNSDLFPNHNMDRH